MPAEATRASNAAADPALLPHWLILGSVTLLGRPEHVRAARQFVARTIGHDHPKADAAMLLTSELVTNAVTHGDGETLTLAIRCSRGYLRIDVYDQSRPLPLGMDGPADTDAGRGLVLVTALSTEWGSFCTPAGKAMYFTLAFPPGQPAGCDRAAAGD